MSSFLMHSVSGARSLLALYETAGVEWFPVTVGYGIARTMFEVDVTAHYIAQSPQERASLYILFEHVLNKKAMDACDKHRKSEDSSWREARVSLFMILRLLWLMRKPTTPSTQIYHRLHMRT